VTTTEHVIVPVTRISSRGLNGTLIAGIALSCVVVAAVLIAPMFLASPTEPHLSDLLQAPSGAHPFGTDQLGRDVLTRVVYAMRVDLGIATLALIGPMLLGSALGAAAAWWGGWVDEIVGVLSDVVQAFPYYLLIIVLVFFLGAGVGSIFVAVALVAWVSYARIMRGEVQARMHEDYVLAARGSGLSEPRVLVRHVLPNCFKQPLAYYVTDVVIVIIGTATLSYLGLGIAPPTPELGSMIADGQQFIGSHPLLSIVPGLAVVLIGVAFSLLGQGLAEQVDQS
jgi:peptide/nickel transport system permease protein